VNRHQPPTVWNPSPGEIARMKQALLNEAYPPAGRTGVGTVLRRY
jgi:hypothetical protein